MMDFNETKQSVLQLYEDFLPLVKKARENQKTSYDASLSTLKAQAQNIRKDEFLLMVAGEAKSGKSTFINAFLGTDILPMDIKQCTSTIVEIRFGEKFVLNATFADGRKIQINDKQKINAFLSENASLHDDDRAIPTSVIDNEILKYKDKKIPQSVMDQLLLGIEKDNSYQLSKTEYKQRVVHYLRERQKNWQQIARRIEIKYPFEDRDMRGIVIVDSPGVNAQGRVGDSTHRYIEKANAVMFLKPIGGTALDATSFKQFLKSKSADRNKDAIFLVLTRAATNTKDDVTRICDDAQTQFPNINPEQIIPVDSKAKLFYNECRGNTQEWIKAKIELLRSENKLESFLEMPWYRSRENRGDYLRQLQELSNFDTVNDAMNRFAHKAQYLGFAEFLKRMLVVLDSMKAKLEMDISYYKQKLKDPHELSRKMETNKTELEELMKKVNETVNKIAHSYLGPKGGIKQRASEVVKQYQIEIDAIDPESSDSVDELEMLSFRRIDAYTEFQEDLRKKIIAEFDKALIKLSDESALQYTTLKPDLTKEMIAAIREGRKDDAEEMKEYTTGRTFKKPASRPMFSQSKYFGLIKRDIDEKITPIERAANKSLEDFVRDTEAAYRQQLKENIQIKEDELKRIVQEQQTEATIRKEMADRKELQAQIKDMAAKVRSIKGGVEEHVRRAGKSVHRRAV